MAILSQLTIYPVKSCAGIALPEATLADTGLAYQAIRDREWMVVDNNGQFVTQRTHPRLAVIVPTLEGERMILRAPNMPPLALPTAPPENAPSMPVRVWKDVIPAIDCGETASAWLSQIIGAPCKLVRFHPQAHRIASRKWAGEQDAPNLFSDAFPFLIIGQSSLDDLNQKLQAQGRAVLPMNRFRPNIVVSGSPAYTEDAASCMTIGSARLQLVKPCQRCPVPAIDQTTGIRGDDPSDILKTYHTSALLNNAVTFGVNAILKTVGGDPIRIGQIVEWETSC